MQQQIPNDNEHIYCYTCKRPVEYQEARRDNECCGTRYRVRCHGETDECFITDTFSYEADGPMLIAVAFQPRDLLTNLSTRTRHGEQNTTAG